MAPGTGDAVDRLSAQTAAGRHLCVGLDTDVRRLPPSLLPNTAPAQRVLAFNTAIIDATAEVACAYKPNLAFYEQLGADGWRALAATVTAVRRRAPDAIVVLDAKRGDIGSSNEAYAAALLDEAGADAVTVHPYLGREALRPFLDRRDALIIVLARTSNPGAGELQDLSIGGVPLFRHLARIVARDWNANGNCGLVVGATAPAELEAVRADVPPDLPFLVPGVGAQGGDAATVASVHARHGSRAFMVNASRSVIFASSGSDFASSAAAEARRLDRSMREVLG